MKISLVLALKLRDKLISHPTLLLKCLKYFVGLLLPAQTHQQIAFWSGQQETLPSCDNWDVADEPLVSPLTIVLPTLAASGPSGICCCLSNRLSYVFSDIKNL